MGTHKKNSALVVHSYVLPQNAARTGIVSKKLKTVIGEKSKNIFTFKNLQNIYIYIWNLQK